MYPIYKTKIKDLKFDDLNALLRFLDKNLLRNKDIKVEFRFNKDCVVKISCYCAFPDRKWVNKTRHQLQYQYKKLVFEQQDFPVLFLNLK